MAKDLNVNLELPEERQQELRKRLDENPANEAIMSPMECIKISIYVGVIDKLIVELDDQFSLELTDFAFLEPNNFGACDVDEFENLLVTTTCSQLVPTSKQE